MCVPVSMCLWADAVCLVICRSPRFTSALILCHSLFLFIDTRSLSCTHSSLGLHSERWNYRQILMPLWDLHKFWDLELILMVAQQVLKTTNRVRSLSVTLTRSHKCDCHFTAIPVLSLFERGLRFTKTGLDPCLLVTFHLRVSLLCTYYVC